MIDYYDKIIVAIAGSLLGGAFLGLLTGLGFQTGLFIGTLIATLFVYHAIFRNPPLPTTDPRVAATAIVWHAFLVVIAATAFF
ncbi:hypothetical protein D8Y22_13640 [Salinadaptatus halalkaliphilus]|uniref:Uncharacterized protein n=1 Tax=Salinadaptatus halalkaliphilus TaxID=2419781 RepID=A0A4V3VL50_9EURY|nr:hypothetical protein [Salinadaptatus halalkaliphilus]THE64317.1 hypothetical protein D8Y22_13640 [Salinadaptatus halalkaliphilus]